MISRIENLECFRNSPCIRKLLNDYSTRKVEIMKKIKKELLTKDIKYFTESGKSFVVKIECGDLILKKESHQNMFTTGYFDVYSGKIGSNDLDPEDAKEAFDFFKTINESILERITVE